MNNGVEPHADQMANNRFFQDKRRGWEAFPVLFLPDDPPERGPEDADTAVV